MAITKEKRKTTKSNHLSVDVTNSDLEPVKATDTEIKRKTLEIIDYHILENYKKDGEIYVHQKLAEFQRERGDELEEENQKLKMRNRFLEKNVGDKSFLEFHDKLKTQKIKEKQKEELDAARDEKLRALCESQGLLKYLNDPKLSQKKKRKS
jgi:hypothetical protein